MEEYKMYWRRFDFSRNIGRNHQEKSTAFLNIIMLRNKKMQKENFLRKKVEKISKKVLTFYTEDVKI